MNEAHVQALSSAGWAQMLATRLLPWLVGAADLGDDVLEIGPGPGLTTDLLRGQASRLTTVEIDADLAAALSVRLVGTGVTVVHGDATATGFDADRFSAVASFGMLHHVPSAERQDRVFAEAHRVLRPGGVFLGTDGLDSPSTRLFHQDDVYVPLDEGQLRPRLEAAGFRDVQVAIAEEGFREVRFVARKEG
jgi:SAM-dependent methyltransferase